MPRLNSGRLMEIGKTLQNDHEKSHQVRVALNWSIAPDLNRLLQLGRLSPLPGEAMQMGQSALTRDSIAAGRNLRRESNPVKLPSFEMTKAPEHCCPRASDTLPTHGRRAKLSRFRALCGALECPGSYVGQWPTIILAARFPRPYVAWVNSDPHLRLTSRNYRNAAAVVNSCATPRLGRLG